MIVHESCCISFRTTITRKEKQRKRKRNPLKMDEASEGNVSCKRPLRRRKTMCVSFLIHEKQKTPVLIIVKVLGIVQAWQVKHLTR